VDVATQQAARAGERDDAMQRLRDLTLAIGIGAFGALGLFAWISAATIPGVAGSGQPASPASNDSQQPTSTFFGDDGQQQPILTPANSGSGIAVSGGSHAH
jgi:hypothetical protein